MAMADKIKMSDNNNLGGVKNENAALKSGRRTTEKPQMILYRPRSGMTLKRSDPMPNDSWRKSKSPSPSPAELLASNQQNRQVVETDVEINSVCHKMKELKVSVASPVIDLTLSSNEEKKRVKKPEQQLYVPKPVKLDWTAHVEEENVPVDKNRSKKKPKRKAGEKFEENRDRRQGSEPRSVGRGHPQRMRDSRSMEHGWSEAGERRAPHFRRNTPNSETLPPRLQKKYPSDSGKGYSHIGGNSEEDWDGASLSFTNHVNTQETTESVPVSRGRGRGRIDIKPELNWGDTSSRSKASDDSLTNIRVKKPESDQSDGDKKLELKVTQSTPGILTLHSTPGKKMSWADLMEEKDYMSSSSSPSSFPAPPEVPAREKRKNRGKERGETKERHRDRRTSEESSGRGSSRERNDWRRRDGDNWRKAPSEDAGSWRSAPVAPQPPQGYVQMQVQTQRQLFDPSNPARPIIVSAANIRNPVVTLSDKTSYSMSAVHYMNSRGYAVGDSIMAWNGYAHISQQSYVNDNSLARHPRHLETLKFIEAAGLEIYYHLSTARQKGVLDEWGQLKYPRDYLRTTLMEVVRVDLKFCLTDQIAHQVWLITYHNVIETLKELLASNPDRRSFHIESLNGLIDEGCVYFKKIIAILEDSYNFKLDDYATELDVPEKSIMVSMAVNMAQQVMLCLGDLVRYREDISNGNNYGKSKMYYCKAQLLNPKNGRPYYQLGTIATLTRRRMDAVYYYMRSLMATNPMDSARESLSLTFEESRKKLESILKSRAEERLTDKESRENTNLRREIWIHPLGGRRVHRTTSTSTDSRKFESEDEDLGAISSNDIHRRFTASFLLVHGKLFTKVGMERFQDAAVQMLREFRVILHFHPIPITLNRLLQLTALNIFSIEHTKLKDPPPEPGYRSAVQMNALIVALQMLNLMLERCLSLLKEQVAQGSDQLDEDLMLFLPAIKIWCDWLLTHGSLWTPPPCCDEFRVGPPGNCWGRLASLVNFLEENSFWKVPIVTLQDEGYEPVKLPEDTALLGFTPLNLYDPDPVYTTPDTDMDAARCCLRFRKILFFAEEFLCGLNPPILKVQQEEGRTVFISVANASNPTAVQPIDDDQSDAELMVESFSEEEDSDDRSVGTLSEDSETRRLLRRKVVLERRHQRQERHHKRVQALIEQNGLSVEVEVRPRYLVPDTNCFIDYLPELKLIASTSALLSTDPYYILNVPLIVVTELEGLSRGGRHRDKLGLSLGVQAHSATVSEDAKEALEFLRTPARTLSSVRCVTQSGKVLKSFMPFSIDGDADRNETNDDKILATCLSLCKHPVKEEPTKPGVPRRLTRDVVLLTDDRHLRVKALARDLPVRKVRDFIQWAELG